MDFGRRRACDDASKSERHDRTLEDVQGNGSFDVGAFQEVVQRVRLAIGDGAEAEAVDFDDADDLANREVRRAARRRRRHLQQEADLAPDAVGSFEPRGPLVRQVLA